MADDPLRGLTVRRADKTVTGRTPSSSYEVTPRLTGRCRLESRQFTGMTGVGLIKGQALQAAPTLSQSHQPRAVHPYALE